MSGFGAGIGVGIVAGLLLGLCGTAAVAYAASRRLIRERERALRAERLAELGTLTGGLAHEIKNPLSTIGLNLQLLGEDLPDDLPDVQRIHNRLATVQREAGRLRDILDDFMRYAGRIELDPSVQDINPLLEDVVDFFAPQAQQARVRMRFQPHGSPLVASVDARLLKQAMLNLLLNAVQAMGDAGGELIVSAVHEPHWVKIDVIDTGPGIAPDVAERIFDAYFSTKRSGTGLGLAITRRIAEEHGGSISLTSELGKGSDFTIRIPAA